MCQKCECTAVFFHRFSRGTLTPLSVEGAATATMSNLFPLTGTVRAEKAFAGLFGISVEPSISCSVSPGQNSHVDALLFITAPVYIPVRVYVRRAAFIGSGYRLASPYVSGLPLSGADTNKVSPPLLPAVWGRAAKRNSQNLWLFLGFIGRQPFLNRDENEVL